MTEDKEGFLYPHIDKSVCLNCGQCEKVCPVLNEYSGSAKTAYACMNNNTSNRLAGSSGGVFILLAEYVIKKSGVVFGAAYDDNLNVKHICISDIEDIPLLMGSKYVQSRIDDTYKKAKEYLDTGRLVLFSGTPCQIGGIKAYLKKDYDNLILQDIVCHGVPSPLVWQKYLEYQSKIHGAEVCKKTLPNFRNKDSGWKNYSVSLHFENGEEYISVYKDDLFMKAFLRNLSLRPSCYNCHFKSVKRESDITLADFWGADKLVPEMFDDKGISLVLVNSEKGEMIFKEISSDLNYKEINRDEALKYNPSAYTSSNLPKQRRAFMKNIAPGNFRECVMKYTKGSLIRRVINRFIT